MPDVHVSRAGYLSYYYSRRRRKARLSGGETVLPIPEALWVGNTNPVTLQVEIPDGVDVEAGDEYVWQLDTVATFNSGDLVEVEGTISAGDLPPPDGDGEIDETMPDLALGLWYARFRMPNKTDWSNTISQTIVEAVDEPPTFDSSLIKFDSTAHTFDEAA